jgi:alpha-amylase
MEKSLCFYFQVHQPDRLRLYRFFDIGGDSQYFDEFSNKTILKRVSERCYLPMNDVLLDLIKQYGGEFKVAFSLSGTVLEQFSKYVPEVIDSFRALCDTVCVEFLAETYSHSLASLISKKAFEEHVAKHAAAIEHYFGYKPKTFRNTELIYSDKIGEMVAGMGYDTMLTEGAKHILGWKSPNFVYTNAINPRLKLLLRNFSLSDDLAFRFNDRSNPSWPITSEKYAKWISASAENSEVVNLFMDYETFGEHQPADSGIFEFMKYLPKAVLSEGGFKFRTPSEVSSIHQPVAPLHVPFAISWADEERDTSAWLGNDLQNEAFKKLYSLEKDVEACTDEKIKDDFLKLQESDHFYYMCTKFFSDGSVHKYFNPYETPYEAFINYMNVLSDFEIRVANAPKDLLVAAGSARKAKPAAKKKRTSSASAKISMKELADDSMHQKATEPRKVVEVENVVKRKK